MARRTWRSGILGLAIGLALALPVLAWHRLAPDAAPDATALALARADSALRRADSALAVATAALARLDTSAVPAPPALAPLPGRVPAAGLDTLVALGDVASTDSVAVTPTAAELATLAGSLIVPVDGVQPSELVNSFGDARGGGTRTHHALDIAAPLGTTVRSATGGRVLRLFTSVTGGLMVYAADSSERFVLLYGHLDAYAPGLRDGVALRRGQPLGTVGTTGNARGIPHLHFGIHRTRDVSRWWLGMPVDPWGLLRAGSR